jgi:hypothetical protein
LWTNILMIAGAIVGTQMTTHPAPDISANDLRLIAMMLSGGLLAGATGGALRQYGPRWAAKIVRPR